MSVMRGQVGPIYFNFEYLSLSALNTTLAETRADFEFKCV